MLHLSCLDRSIIPPFDLSAAQHRGLFWDMVGIFLGVGEAPHQSVQGREGERQV